jgi:hypothetical protein
MCHWIWDELLVQWIVNLFPNKSEVSISPRELFYYKGKLHEGLVRSGCQTGTPTMPSSRCRIIQLIF